MICLALDGSTMAENLRILRSNLAYVQILELRADMLDLSSRISLLEVMDFPSQTKLPVILTIRRKADGGCYAGSEEDRKSLLKELSQAPFSFVDMEIDLNYPSLELGLIAQGKRVIRSLHDFSGGIPRDLPELARAVYSCGEIPKIAVTPKGVADELELFRIGALLTNLHDKIIIGMGKFGLPTRILYKRLGGMLTFASATDPGNIGLPTPKMLHEQYHANEITEETILHAMVNARDSKKVSSPKEAFVPFMVDDKHAFRELCELLGIKN